MGFLALLLELSFVNTVLVFIPEIKHKIEMSYGKEFIRYRGQNSQLSSLAYISERLFIIAVGIDAAFCGAAARQMYDTLSYERNSKYYVNTLENNT